MNSAWIYAALLLTFASKNAYSQAPFVDEHRNRPDPRFSSHLEHPPSFSGPNRPPFSSRGGDQPPVNGNFGGGDDASFQRDPTSPGTPPSPPLPQQQQPPPPPQQRGPSTPPSTTPGPDLNTPVPPQQPQRGGPPPLPTTGPSPPTSPNNTRNPFTPQTPNTNAQKPGGCRRIVRQEIKDLSSGDRQRYWNAIKGIMRRTNGPSPYDLFTKDHDDHSPLNHGTPMFLVWHRVFIRKFELAIQRVDSSVAAHYWDWSADAQAPELSIIFSSTWYGSNGDQRRGNCIADGQFNSFQPFYRSGSPCLTRKFNRGNRIGSFVAPEVLSRYISSSRSYDSFRLAIEGQPHAAVHNGIGSGFSTMRSPNDPIFWLHHTFVDKLYMDWQLQNPRRFGEVNGRNANEYTIMKPWNERASLGAAIELYGGCISYASPVNAFRGGRQQRGPVTRGNDDGDDDNDGGNNGWNQQPTRGNGLNVPNRGGPVRWTRPIRFNPGQRQGNRGPIHFSPRPTPIRRGRWQRRQLEDGADDAEQVDAEHGGAEQADAENGDAEHGGAEQNDDGAEEQVTSDANENESDNATKVDENNTTNGTLENNGPNNSTTAVDSLIEVVKDPAPEDVPNLCYDNNGVETPCADDRENILDLRSPVPIPDDYLRMNNQNITYIRAQEAETSKLVKKLNNLEGYVSPCALLNREDFLVKLAKKGTEFKQVVKGKLVKVHLDKEARKSPHTFVEKLKKQFTRIGYNVVKSYDSIQTGIHRILGSGTEYMYNHFHNQKGSAYYENEDELEYCEDD